MKRIENNYEEKLDKIFSKGLWKHRTFRTVLDPYSSEWHHTTYEQKIDILKKIYESNEGLGDIIVGFKRRYKEQNRIDIANDVDLALLKLLMYTLTGDDDNILILREYG